MSLLTVIVLGDLGSLPITTDMIISKAVIILQYYGCSELRVSTSSGIE